jgi:hypothetical protein
MACEDVVKAKYATNGLMNLTLRIDYHVLKRDEANDIDE